MVPTVPLTVSDRPGPALLLHPAGPFPLPPLPAPADPPGRLDPESSQPRREQRSRLLPLPAQNLADPLPGARRRGRPGWRPSARLPSEDRAPICPCSCPRRPGWGPSSARASFPPCDIDFTAFLNNPRGQAPRCASAAERGTHPHLAPIHPAKVNRGQRGAPAFPATCHTLEPKQ